MSDPREPTRSSGWHAVRLGALALILGAGALGYWYFSHMGAGGGTNTAAPAAAAAAAPLPVTVSRPVTRQLIEWDEFTGQFSAVEYVEVRARVSGFLDSIHFEDGQIVKQGDPLFVIDPRPFDITLASAKAQATETMARLELARRQLTRAGQLRDRDVVALSTYDERVEELNAATAALEGANAAVRAAELNMEFTRVTAPVSGRIGRHEVSVGNLISGGESSSTTLLTTIVSLDPIHFLFDMSEADFLGYQRAVADGRLKSTRDGSVEVNARLVDEQDWTLTGRLDFVDNQVDRTSGTIRARAVFPNPSRLVTPGQFGRLRLPGSERYEAILVPDSAIVTDQSNKIVMTVMDDGTVVPKAVRPGPREAGLRIIRSGLSSDDQIIINGLMRVRPGIKVAPQPGSIEPIAASAESAAESASANPSSD
jgi:RND family efflux transporter MFP subunit